MGKKKKKEKKRDQAWTLGGAMDRQKRSRRSRLRHLFWAHLRRVKGPLLLAGLLTVAVSAVGLLKPWPLKFIIDYGIVRDEPLPSSLSFLSGFVEGNAVTFLVLAAGGIVAVAVLDAVLQYFHVFITSSVGYRVVYSLRRELFTHMQRLSLSFHNKARAGDLLSRIASDTNDLKNLFSDSILEFVANIIMVIGMFAILVWLDWRIAVIALSTLPFLSFSLFHVYRKTKLSAKVQKKQEGKVNARMTEVLSAIPLVQAYAGERHEEEKFDAVTSVTLRESIRIARLKAIAKRSSEIITEVGTAVAVLYAAVQVLRGELSIGDLTLVLSYVGKIYKPIKGLAKLSTEFSKSMASADRLSEVLDVEPEIQDRPHAIEATRLKGEIVFDNVYFDYGDGKDVLRNVSFTVSPGQRLAVVGVSGAGKSTIGSLILRLYEAQEGAIYIDGVDVRDYTRDSLRRQMGIVLQQAILFGETVRENIAYGKPEASPDEIVAAAKAANADEFIRELEDGYDTEIGERGTTLSGGQRQRIAIARALIRDAPILVLDEPMTGLDVESEAKVREALNRLMADRTCVMITHDLPSIADADMVLVLEDGQIIARGTHTELMASSRRYREVYEMGFEPDGEDSGRAKTKKTKPARDLSPQESVRPTATAEPAQHEMPAALDMEPFPAGASQPRSGALDGWTLDLVLHALSTRRATPEELDQIQKLLDEMKERDS